MAKGKRPAFICPSCDRKWHWDFHTRWDGDEECPDCYPRFVEPETLKNKRKRLALE